MRTSEAQAFLPTTGTLFCGPLDQTGITVWPYSVGTDAESVEVVVFGPESPLSFGGQEEGGQVPDVSFERAERVGAQNRPVRDGLQVLNQTEDPELAALWNNPSDDEFDAP